MRPQSRFGFEPIEPTPERASDIFKHLSLGDPGQDERGYQDRPGLAVDSPSFQVVLHGDSEERKSRWVGFVDVSLADTRIYQREIPPPKVAFLGSHVRVSPL